MTRAAAVLLRAGAALGVLILVGVGALVAYSYSLALPAELLGLEKAGPRVFDRHGQLLGRLRAEGDVWYQPIGPADVGRSTFAVLLAAEDARFWSHPGVDPLAVARAGVQALTHGRIVSGASTITQQLARTCFPRPRNLWGKLEEMALALRIERSLSKERILVAYLNRVHFGPQVLGMAAASDRYLGKPIGALDLAETALLVAVVRGPSVYDLERHLARARERRDVILRRAAAHGLLPERDVQLALATPASLRPHAPWSGAWHFTRRVAARSPGSAEITSTIDLGLQRQVEELALHHQRQLAQDGVSAVAVLVTRTESAEILAYVGSQDPKAARNLGQNDGVTSRRQPGSALKPLLYAAAIDHLGLTPQTRLPDEPLTFRTPTGHYAPENYDRRFRGPVTMSRALASSLNVPAVFTLERLGVARGLATLRDFGLETLDRDAEHYGLGLALGGGEVTLLELTTAYGALARGGVYRSPRWRRDQSGGVERRAVSASAAESITAILGDGRARAELLGPSFAEDASFALKTGTSSGHRDAWAFVYDQEVTVGVWVGNFDGTPMVKTSGAYGAAPLAVGALRAARRAGRASDDRTPGRRAVAADPAVPRGSGSVVAERPQIVFPADGARLLPKVPHEPIEIVLRATRAPRGARLLLDGQRIEWNGESGRERALVTAGIGQHRARLVDANGAELSSVTFHVIAPG